MIKVHILTDCSQCNGEAYLPFGEAEDSRVKNLSILSHALFGKEKANQRCGESLVNMKCSSESIADSWRTI